MRVGLGRSLPFLLLLGCGPAMVRAEGSMPAFPDGREVLPPESVAVAEEGHSFVFNPAGPAFTRPSSFEFYQTFIPSLERSGPGDIGRGLYWSLPGLRLGWQYVATEKGPGHGSLSFSQSRLISPAFGFGTSLNYHYFLHTEDSLAGLLGLNLGFLFRTSDRLSFGLTVSNALSPDASLPEFRTRTRFGVGLRPFGEKLTLAADVSAPVITLPDDPTIDLTTTALFEPAKGFRFHGSFEWLDVVGSKPAYVVGMGLTMRLGNLSVGDQGFLAAEDGGVRGASDSFYVATSSRRAPTVLTEGGLSGQIWQVTLKDKLEAPPSEGSLTARPARVPLLYQLQRLREAMDNPRVHGVLLVVDDHDGGLAEVQELRALVERLREHGKPVVAYLHQPSARDLYLASACSRVVLHPAGELRLEPPHRETWYLKGLLEKAGLEAEVARRGSYKSAPEPLIAREPSPATVEMNRALLEDLFDQLVDGITRGRRVPEAEVRAAFTKLLIPAEEARSLRLVDDLRYPEELEPIFKEVYGRAYPVDEDDKSAEKLITRWGPQVKIGLVYLDGTIQRGEGGLPESVLGKGVISSRETVKALRDLAKDIRVKAVVLRIDSPGGGVFASDEIWNAVRQVRKKKPVIVSMSNVAASGGYYLALSADVLLADPATLTGSIGVYSVKPNAQELLRKLEVVPQSFAPEGVTRTELDSISRPWTEDERATMEASVEKTYQQFLRKVAEGRKMSVEEIEPLAGGRVWTGRQAVEHRLVDRIGGLDDALTLAKERAGVKRHETVMLEVWPRKSLQDTILSSTLGESAGRWIGRFVGAFRQGVRRELTGPTRPAYEVRELPETP